MEYLVLALMALVILFNLSSRGSPFASGLIIIFLLFVLFFDLYLISRGLNIIFDRNFVNSANEIYLIFYYPYGLDEELEGIDPRILVAHLFDFFLVFICISLIWRVMKPSIRNKEEISKHDISKIFKTRTYFSYIIEYLILCIHNPKQVSSVIQIVLATVFHVFYLSLVLSAVTLPFFGSSEIHTAPKFAALLYHDSPPTEHVTLRFLLANLLALLAIAFILLCSRLNFWFSKLFLALSNRCLVMSAGRIRDFDTRPPVLYLRSFRNDKLPAKAARETGLFAAFDPYRETSTMEQLIVRHCFSMGPVIAIADPKVAIPKFGAARMAAKDEDWKDVVEALMDEAALIVVLMDYTENLQWEIVRLNLGERLAHTIFVFPPETTQEECETMQRILSGILYKDTDNPFASLPAGTRPCIMRSGSGDADIIASQTTTYADFDLGLQLALSADRGRIRSD